MTSGRAPLAVVAALAVGCDRTPAPPPSAPAPSSSVAPATADARDDEAARIAAHNRVVAAAEGGDLDGALALLEKERVLLDGFAPAKSAEVAIRLRRAKAHFAAGRLLDADREISRALMLAPDDEAAKTSAATVLVARARGLGRADARAFLDRALELDPTSAAALVERARIAEAENDLDQARALLERARASGDRVAGLDEKLATLTRHADAEAAFSDVRSTNFVVRFEGYANEVVAWSAIRGLERAFVRVNEALSLTPPDEITVLLYSGEKYREAVGAPDWSGGIFDGKIRIKEGDVARESGKLDDILFHEYAHALLATAITRPLPAWLHEGLAQRIEPGFDRAPRDRVLASTTARFPLDALDASFTRFAAADAQLAYAEAAIIVDRMVARQGFSGIGRVLTLVDGGQPLPEAFPRVFGTDLAAFVDEALR